MSPAKALLDNPTTFRAGCFTGSLFLVLIVAVGLASADGISDETVGGTIGIWLMIALGLAGGATGLTLALRPATRPAGIGILVVVALGPIVIAALYVGLLILTWSE